MRFRFFVSVTPGSPSRVTTHSVLEWAALISTIRPTRAGFHAETTLAKSPGLHRSLLAPISLSTLAPGLPTHTTVCMYSSLPRKWGAFNWVARASSTQRLPIRARIAPIGYNSQSAIRHALRGGNEQTANREKEIAYKNRTITAYDRPFTCRRRAAN